MAKIKIINNYKIDDFNTCLMGTKFSHKLFAGPILLKKQVGLVVTNSSIEVNKTLELISVLRLTETTQRGVSSIIHLNNNESVQNNAYK